MVSNNQAGDMAFNFFKTKVLICAKNKFEAEINTSAETEFEGEHRQDFGRLNYSNAVRCNAKMLREQEVLNEAGDMTAGFFKTKVLMFG